MTTDGESLAEYVIEARAERLNNAAKRPDKTVNSTLGVLNNVVIIVKSILSLFQGTANR